MKLQPPPSFLLSTWARYGVGAALLALAVALALAAHMAPLPAEVRIAFATFYPLVVLTFYLCGIGPGFLVSVLSTAAGVHLVSMQHYSSGFDSPTLIVAIAYLLASAVTGWVVNRLRVSHGALALNFYQLAANEDRLKSIVEDQTEMLFRSGRDGFLAFANSVGRATFGLTDESLRSQIWQDLVAPEERAEVAETLRRLAPDHQVVEAEARFIGANGESRWGEFVHRALFDEQGTFAGIQTVGRDVTDRRALQEHLAEVSASLKDLYDLAPCGYYSLDNQGRYVQLNATANAWLGCPAEEVLGKLGPKDFFTPEGVAEFNRNFPAYMARGHIGPLEFDLVSRDGTVRRVSVSATAIRDASGTFVRSRSVMYDVTELARVRRELHVLNRQQEAMLDNELIGIVKLKDRKAVWENRAMGRMFGYEPGELDSQPARMLYLDDESFESVGKAAYPVLAAGGTYRTQLRMKRKDGQPIWVDASGAMVSPELGESMWMMLDITAMRNHTEEVEKVAFHDALTGLPNRILLADRLQQAIPLAERLLSLFAVCFIDLDGFKAVNDRLGHAAGDKILQVIGDRLLGCVRGNDTVARLGGDEFVLLLTNLQSRDECDQVLTRVVEALGRPVEVGQGVSGQVSASIGVAYCPEDGTDGAHLLKVADEAMYSAKASRSAKDGITDLSR